MTNKEIKFPTNFLWGTSTSAYQTEGGIENDWSEWESSEVRNKELEKEGKNPEEYICGRACDSYHRWREDIEILKNLGCNAYRFGVEWARIEPEEGKFKMEEVEHYREILETLRAKNIKIVLTIWHWTNPKWIGSAGWTDKKTVDHFLRFTELIVKELGNYVDYWNPLNEPLMHIAHGYLTGKFPPNRKKDLVGTIKVFKNLVGAQKGAYKIIHKYFPQAQVGVAMTTGYFNAAHYWNPIELLLAKTGHYFRNLWYLKKINGYFEYIGVNYYHHDRMIWYPPFKKNLDEWTNDFGWEIYPEGIYHVLKDYKKFNKPILVLENGTADADDDHRARFINEHLKWVHRAISEGADVRGYFYWSLLDNFEWADGYKMKFGLFKIDRNTFVRTPQPSSKMYAEICKNNGIVTDNA